MVRWWDDAVMRWLGSSVRMWFVIIVLLGALWVYLASRNDAPEPTNGAIASLVA